MIGISLHVRDTLTPAMRAAGEQASPARLARIAARIAAAEFAAHFERLSRERHRAASAHDFYLAAARATAGTASGRTATVTVAAPTGLRQRYLGGEIRPVKERRLRRGNKTVTYKALWIPVGEAVGRTGGDYRGKLTVVYNLATRKGVAISRETRAVLFALRGDPVTQQADPGVVPDLNDLRRAIVFGIADKLERAWRARRAEG